MSEPSFGAAIVADGPRGYDIRGDALRLTLLRSPRFPDPEADLGFQHLEWSVMLTDGDPVLSGVEEIAALMAHPIRVIDGTPQLPSSGITLSVPGALISAVKPADDDSTDFVVRVWESRGDRTNGTLAVVGATRIVSCDALENPADAPLDMASDGVFNLSLRPFQIATLRITTA